jgi:hypothetical protein
VLRAGVAWRRRARLGDELSPRMESIEPTTLGNRLMRHSGLQGVVRAAAETLRFTDGIASPHHWLGAASPLVQSRRAGHPAVHRAGQCQLGQEAVDQPCSLDQ